MSQAPGTPTGVCSGSSPKAVLRRQLRERLAAMSEPQRHTKSCAACSLVSSTHEFDNARVVMLFLSTPHEIDTAPLALKCWQAGKTVVVPKVSWDQRRMLPVEINGLHQSSFTTTGPGIREPISGKPVPVDFIDLVIVPGLGFTDQGYRIGRGMGFYDRFLAQSEFIGLSCGLAFDEQVVPELPLLDHDVPLSMLVTDRGIRRFATKLIQS
jgi:5-formyltetrahydrofolate cyclo-ligase